MEAMEMFPAKTKLARVLSHKNMVMFPSLATVTVAR
jgi:hypothetical protein